MLPILVKLGRCLFLILRINTHPVLYMCVCVFLVLFRILSLLSDVRSVGKLHFHAAKNKMLTETRYRMRPLNLKVQHRDSSTDSWQLPSYVAIRKVSSVNSSF